MLVDRAVGRNLSLRQGVAEPDKELVAAVDAWENVWFDVADAALQRKFPEVHARVFHKLSKTSGPLVIPNVKVFLDRLAGLEESDADALELLAARGLGEMQREYAAELLAQTRADISEELEPGEEDELAQLDAAIDEMWAWYLDWSVTARTVVKSKRLRIIMGLSSAARSRADEVLEEDADEVLEEDADEVEDEDEFEGEEPELEPRAR